MGVKKIFSFDIPHSVHESLFTNPPRGYKFFKPKDKRFTKEWNSKLRKRLRENTILKSMWEISKKFRNPIFKRYKNLKDIDSERVVREADIIFSGEVLPTNKPYWIEVEHVRQLMGWDIRLLRKNKKWLRKKLEEENCRLITSYTESGIKTVMDFFNSEKINRKCHFVHNAIPSKRFKRDFRKKKSEKIKFLFLGSAALPYDFYMKGGHIALEAFKILKEKYENIEIIVKPWAPKEIKKKYCKIKGVKFLNYSTKEELENILRKSDILLSPNHNTPANLFLDAMNYSIPVITTDLWANSEIIKEGYNGLLIKKSYSVPYFIENNIPNSRSKEYNKKIKKLDLNMVQELVEKSEILILNENMRRELGKNGKKEVDNGKFSIRKRNKKYKKLLDKYFKA